MNQDVAVAYAEKCMNGEPAPCSFACPFMLDVRSMMEKAGKGRWNAAYKALRVATLFPTIVSALCPAPCEGECLRKQTGDEPLSVRLIEDACIRFAKNKNPDKYVLPPKTGRIAIVGAGIAGLSAALCLAQKNFPVTVFEKSDAWGGNLRSAPQFPDFDVDIALQFSVTETEFRFGTEILSLQELNEYDLVYVATGVGGIDFGLLSGWDPALLTTRENRVFLGGALVGAGLNEAIVQGKSWSKTAEVFLQTGRAEETYGMDKGIVCDIDCSGMPPSPRIAPSDSGRYAEDEAKSEAGRCFLCDCEMCMVSCEMLGSFRKKPKKIAMEVYTDTKAAPPYSTHTLTREVYSCNMCGHCKAICPNDVDIGALLQTSRAYRAGGNDYPEAFHDYWLREMDFSTSEASFIASSGTGAGHGMFLDIGKAAGDNAPQGEPDLSGRALSYLFYPGCQLGAHNPDYVVKSYGHLMESHDAGIFVGCCGAPAFWAGDTKRQNANFESIRYIWREVGQPIFVFACATCESLFDMFLPEIRRVSLYELLAQSEGICPEAVFEAASVFDPCNARKNPGMEAAVRDIAQKSGAMLSELPEKNRCCGYGGHMRLANPSLYDEITENRARMGDDPYIVYCVNCREVFSSRGKDSAHILDIFFGLPRGAGVPSIDEKRGNALKVKSVMYKNSTGEDIEAPSREWDAIELVVDAGLAADVDMKLIALSDIKEAIWHAENTGDKFVDEDDGVCQCSMTKPVLTFWVQYRKTDNDTFEVFGAYYHRMKIGEEA